MKKRGIMAAALALLMLVIALPSINVKAADYQGSLFVYQPDDVNAEIMENAVALTTDADIDVLNAYCWVRSEGQAEGYYALLEYNVNTNLYIEDGRSKCTYIPGVYQIRVPSGYSGIKSYLAPSEYYQSIADTDKTIVVEFTDAWAQKCQELAGKIDEAVAAQDEETAAQLRAELTNLTHFKVSVYEGEKEYKVLDGNGSEYDPDAEGADGGLSIRIDCELSKFQQLMVDDGGILSGDNYNLTEGSTIVTFKKSYLDTLSAGTHTVRILFADGSAEATFNIKAKSASADTTPASTTPAASVDTTPAPAPAATSTDTTSAPAATAAAVDTVPKTGEGMMVYAWAVILSLAAMGTSAYFFMKKRA